jgi:hypothetical protein
VATARNAQRRRHRGVEQGYSDFLGAVQAASLVRLDESSGTRTPNDVLNDSFEGPRYIDQMLSVLEDEKATTVIKEVVADESPTVKSFLAGIGNDAERYWPEEVSRIDRVRESLP